MYIQLGKDFQSRGDEASVDDRGLMGLPVSRKENGAMAFYMETVLGEPLEGLGEDKVLHPVDAFFKSFEAVAFRIVHDDRDGSLDDKRPAVEDGVHEVDRAAGNLDAVVVGVGDSGSAGETRKNRGVEIDYPAGVGVYELLAEDPHPSGEGYSVDVIFVQGVEDHRIVLFPVRDPFGRDDLDGDAEGSGPFHYTGILAVGEDHCDFGVESAAAGGLDDCLGVGAVLGG